MLMVKVECLDMVMFNVEFVYVGLFKIMGVLSEYMYLFVMIECLWMIFLFVWNILFEVICNGGFLLLMLDLIDFV